MKMKSSFNIIISNQTLLIDRTKNFPFRIFHFFFSSKSTNRISTFSIIKRKLITFLLFFPLLITCHTQSFHSSYIITLRNTTTLSSIFLIFHPSISFFIGSYTSFIILSLVYSTISISYKHLTPSAPSTNTLPYKLFNSLTPSKQRAAPTAILSLSPTKPTSRHKNS